MKSETEVGIDWPRWKALFMRHGAPCLMMICTSFTLQYIGHSFLDSWRFLRLIGGTMAVGGMLFPLLFLADQNEKQVKTALVASLILSVVITNGYLCVCN